jgi:hypothetical protein
MSEENCRYKENIAFDVPLPALIAVSPMEHQYSGDVVSKPMLNLEYHQTSNPELLGVKESSCPGTFTSAGEFRGVQVVKAREGAPLPRAASCAIAGKAHHASRFTLHLIRFFGWRRC